MKRYALALSVFTLGCALTGPVLAQEPAAPAPPDAKVEEAQRLAPKLVRLRLVLERSEGRKKTGSIPYTLVISTQGRKGRLRMGVEVPIAVASEGPASFQYRNVGTNVDCSARELPGGRYELDMSVENSSIYQGSQTDAGRGATIAPERPMFRSFRASLPLVLRDGQTLQTVASTDPITGEVVTIDVTLDVVK